MSPPLDTHTSFGCLPLRHLLRRRRDDSDHIRATGRNLSAVDSSISQTDYLVPLSFESCCDFSSSRSVHRDDPPPCYSSSPIDLQIKADFMTTIDTTIDTFDSSLRSLSLRLHDHPELMFQEKYAHDALADFVESHGFLVTRHYLGLETAWRAEFTHGKGGRTLGINAEMDALPLIGHACGHNLIAASGVGIAIAVKSALQAHDISGRIILLGTPGEEGGGGKIILLERGAYNGMHVCLMCHPSAGSEHSSSLGTTLAMQSIDVEFFGHAAHAGNTPWEGTNALDAAFLAYSSVSVFRQQMKPDHRVQGILHGGNGEANVIPDYAKMRWLIRAPDRDQLRMLRDRVKACFEGASIATSCRLKVTLGKPYYDLRQNRVLAEYFSHSMSNYLGVDIQQRDCGASTDFGNVSYELPSLHPAFAIPTQPNGGNHTRAFAESARSTEAHEACMIVSKGLAWTGFRVLADDAFYHQVRTEYETTVGV